MASGKTRFTLLSTATHDAPWSFLLLLLYIELILDKNFRLVLFSDIFNRTKDL